MKHRLFAAAILGTASMACAQGLELCYETTDLGNGWYGYEFQLRPDSGWVPGMGWRWFIFGDVPRTPRGTPGISLIADFAMVPAQPTQFPVGPWTSLTSSGGDHSGPTFDDVLEYWIPASGRETLSWTGQSRRDVAQGELLFSTLAGTRGGASEMIFEVATLGCITVCPCACNFDTSTGIDVCDIFDFLNFQNAFVAGEDCACLYDNSGSIGGICDIFDFLEFQLDFIAGCP